MLKLKSKRTLPSDYGFSAHSDVFLLSPKSLFFGHATGDIAPDKMLSHWLLIICLRKTTESKTWWTIYQRNCIQKTVMPDFKSMIIISMDLYIWEVVCYPWFTMVVGRVLKSLKTKNQCCTVVFQDLQCSQKRGFCIDSTGNRVAFQIFDNRQKYISWALVHP